MTTRPTPPTLRTVVLLAAHLGAAGVLCCVAACAKPLLGPTDERTPFDRYDNVRGNYAPQYIENEYGHREPNLRGRLDAQGISVPGLWRVIADNSLDARAGKETFRPPAEPLRPMPSIATATQTTGADSR